MDECGKGYTGRCCKDEIIGHIYAIFWILVSSSGHIGPCVAVGDLCPMQNYTEM